MFTDGSGKNGLAVIACSRTESDKHSGGVLRYWGFGAQCIGRNELDQTLRIAIREHGDTADNKKGLMAQRANLWRLLHERNIKAVIVIPAPPSGAGANEKNDAWTMLTGRSDNPYGWAGTAELMDGIYVCPVLNPSGWEWAYHWLIRRWFLQGLGIARGSIRPRPFSNCGILTKDYLSVDIETSKDRTILTFIGVWDSAGAVSIGWDEYQVAGTARLTSPRTTLEEEYIREILASNIPKVGHNLSFDIFELRKRGIEVNGEVHYTLLLARTVYPQFARGLQQSTAIEFTVEPWKKLYKAPRVGRGLDKWIADPEGTQAYNLKDVLATSWIYEALSAKIS